MKKKLPLEFATRIINNGPLVVVGTTGDKWNDFAPVAWTMPTSKNPATITLCIGPAHQTWRNIKKNREFTCNIPGKNLIKEVAFFGGVSGDEHDKISITGIKTQKAETIDAPVWADTLAHLECRLISMDESTHLVKAEITAAFAEEQAFEDHWKLTDEFPPLHHMGAEFYECGGKEYIQPRLKSWN